MTRKNHWEYIRLIGICAVYLGFTLYRLPALPGEWYGDISIEHQAVTAILSGHWPWQFNLSAGPAYHYIVAAFAYFLGANYATYKLASVLTGLVVIILTYLLGKEFGGSRVGLFAALAGAVSFWLILFARLGSSPQILSPVLSAGAVYFLLRYRRTRRWYDAAISMVFAGWGLFTYPSTFVLPALLLALILWQLIFTPDRALWWRALAVAAIVLLPFAIGFVLTIKANSAFSQNGYVVSKIAEQSETPASVVLTFGKNMLKALGMFQWTGDHAFRTNVPGSPTLDPLSGVLLDLGLAWLFINPRLRPRWAYVIAPFILLLMPSAAPGILPSEIPSASRALGVAPFAFLLVGTGMEAVWTAARRLIESKGKLPFHLPRLTRSNSGAPISDRSIPMTGGDPRSAARASWVSAVLVGLALLGMGYFNIHHYFVDYAAQLPGHNQPWNQLIAQYIETLPAHTTVRMVTCCWQDTEQPSLQVVGYQLQGMKPQATLYTKAYLKSCQELKPGQRYAIIFPPKEDSLLVQKLRGCFPYSARQMHYDGIGQPAFFTLLIDLRPASQAVP